MKYWAFLWDEKAAARNFKIGARSLCGIVAKVQEGDPSKRVRTPVVKLLLLLD